MPEMNFERIVARGGSQRDAFEELCCQLARKSVDQNLDFQRLHGAGGDGGIECYVDVSNKERIGWQAKYVFDVGALITQATDSLNTALRMHPQLTRFVLCFPFDLTGPTGRRGKSGIEKYDEWREAQIASAFSTGRNLVIETWSASDIRLKTLDADPSGGIRQYFFNDTAFSPKWFERQLINARSNAGPRYTPELNVETDVSRWFAAFGRLEGWADDFKSLSLKLNKKCQRFEEAVDRKSGDRMSPQWPEDSQKEAIAIRDQVKHASGLIHQLLDGWNRDTYGTIIGTLGEALSNIELLESTLVEDLEKHHGEGRADSPGFRQFMAEYEVSFPAANLDTTRELLYALSDLREFLVSPLGWLAFSSAFVLSGGWGVGKTHGVCDVAFQRLEKNAYSCVVFGHQFDGTPDPWTRFAETLGMSANIGKDVLLDALNSAAESTGQVLIIFVDAVNETRPIDYWRNRTNAFIEDICSRPYLRVCLTCRTPYLDQSLPDAHKLSILEHKGFEGLERVACNAFFNYYGLNPPLFPILQPELANPLYLRLVCETLRSTGIGSLPIGWSSTGQVVSAFLEEKEREFSREKGVGIGARVVTLCLQSIARKLADSGCSVIGWSKAQALFRDIRTDAESLGIIEWLIGANLLIEDVTPTTSGIPSESTVRLAFERLGDFLIANEIIVSISDIPIREAFAEGGIIYPFFKNVETIEQNYGVLSALSILLPEYFKGEELSDYVETRAKRELLLKLIVEALPGRDPKTFSAATQSLLEEALRNPDISAIAMDSILAVSWQVSIIDAFWLHGLLNRLPLAQRDAYWSGFLNESYEQSKSVRKLIEAVFILPLDLQDQETAKRWAIVLLWFTAAANRLVKDWSTRALTRLLGVFHAAIPMLISNFIDVDDDEVRERLLLTVYGALIYSTDREIVPNVVNYLDSCLQEKPTQFANAILRDNVRCIAELSNFLGILPNEVDPLASMQIIDSEWPLEIPEEEDVNTWGEILRFTPNEFHSDFFKYSMSCLRPWTNCLAKTDMGKWILQRAVRDFQYEGSGCDRYDRYTLAKHGGGRSKPNWAERIAKKYLWLAMYQLASRLNDNCERAQREWDPEFLQTPLLLVEERKLDPTLYSISPDECDCYETWWINGEADLDTDNQLSDEDWVARETDIPDLEQLLLPIKYSGQTWNILNAHLSWGKRSEEAGDFDPYRNVWMHIHGYLVGRKNLRKAFECLHRRNFFGQWMPEGATWLYGFAGEYPWATPFNIESEEWRGGGGDVKGVPFELLPAASQLAIEWEYDGTLTENRHMLVPARKLFEPGDLWWDGTDGYRLLGGRTVFRDPSVHGGGESSLLMDLDDVIDRLKKLGLNIVWTVLGEKWILGDMSSRATPQRSFSQIALLTSQGNLHVGDRVFFEDYDQDAGPNCDHKLGYKLK